MAQSNGASQRGVFKRAALCGLLALSLPLAVRPLREASAGDGVVRMGEPALDGYVGPHASRGPACPVYRISDRPLEDAELLNVDDSFGFGRGRIPFDRWYYLRRAFGYSRIYPADTHYSDPRDRRVYSAWGYGIPMAVPLQPNVEYQYNYSHGPQGSRLTPVSRPGW